MPSKNVRNDKALAATWGPKEWAPIIAAVVALVSVPLGIILENRLNSPPAPACSFRGVVHDEDQFTVVGARVGYFSDSGEGDPAFVVLAVADQAGKIHGQCPDDSEVAYPVKLLVKRGPGYDQRCLYDPAEQLVPDVPDQELFLDLQLAAASSPQTTGCS